MRLIDLHHALGYRPHFGQLQFHESDARFKILVAGARFGKSLAAARDVLPELLAGAARGWFAAPTYALARPEFRYLRDDLVRRLGASPSREQDGGRTGPSGLATPWGAEVWTVSAHAPEGLLGEELDWLVLCEAAHIRREAFERFLRARLATREGRLIVPTTPRGHNWIHELYRRGIGDAAASWESFRYATWDNPHVSREEIDAARLSLPAEIFDEQYGGAFTARSGRVYDSFQRALHVRPGLGAPQGAVVCRAIDFGYTNPFVCLWAAEDCDGRLVVFDEYVRASATLDLHAAEIRRRDDALRAHGHPIGPALADPSGRLEREQLAAAGVPNLPADNALLAGIDAVRKRLAPRPDGAPGLLVGDRCAELIREFEFYRYAETAEGAEPLPLKRDDHALDALRYLCVGLERRAGWRNLGPLW